MRSPDDCAQLQRGGVRAKTELPDLEGSPGGGRFGRNVATRPSIINLSVGRTAYVRYSIRNSRPGIFANTRGIRL
jgi:hypothetical protein